MIYCFSVLNLFDNINGTIFDDVQ